MRDLACARNGRFLLLLAVWVGIRERWNSKGEHQKPCKGRWSWNNKLMGLWTAGSWEMEEVFIFFFLLFFSTPSGLSVWCLMTAFDDGRVDFAALLRTAHLKNKKQEQRLRILCRLRGKIGPVKFCGPTKSEGKTKYKPKTEKYLICL